MSRPWVGARLNPRRNPSIPPPTPVPPFGVNRVRGPCYLTITDSQYAEVRMAPVRSPQQPLSSRSRHRLPARARAHRPPDLLHVRARGVRGNPEAPADVAVPHAVRQQAEHFHLSCSQGAHKSFIGWRYPSSVRKVTYGTVARQCEIRYTLYPKSEEEVHVGRSTARMVSRAKNRP